MTRARSCPESFGHDELPGIVVPYPKGHGNFRMPCSNPEPGHTLHRVHYKHEGGGRVVDIVIEWTVEKGASVALPPVRWWTTAICFFGGHAKLMPGLAHFCPRCGRSLLR